jgi:hypothetical protein
MDCIFAHSGRKCEEHLFSGTPSVTMGALFNVLRVLGLHEDFLKSAADDELGRKLHALNLLAGE